MLLKLLLNIILLPINLVLLDDLGQTIIVVLVGVIIVALILKLLTKLLRRITPMTKEQALQHEINKRAADPTPMPRKKKSKLVWIIIIILLILLFSWIWLGREFHPGAF